MNKQAYLEETYDSAFDDELEKIALISPNKAIKSYSGIKGLLKPKASRKRLKKILSKGVDSNKKILSRRVDAAIAGGQDIL